MGRLGISDLPWPDHHFRIDLLPQGAVPAGDFETSPFSRKEDAKRMVLLESNIESAPHLYLPGAATDLANRLRYGEGVPPFTPASHLWMRRQRVKLIGAVWKLVAEGGWDPTRVSTFSAMPRPSEFTPDTLNQANARNIMQSFRSDLNRCRAGDADGFLIAFLHGEYEPESEVYRLHFHGVAAHGMLDVIDGLTSLANYKHERNDIVRSRKFRSRLPLTRLPYPIGYQFKSYWPSRRIGPVGKHGESGRNRRGQRIPEPFHSQVLLWLDQWELEDMTLLMKMSVGREGFRLTAH